MTTQRDYIEAQYEQIDRIWSLIRTLSPGDTPIQEETLQAIYIELAALEAIILDMEEAGY